MTKKRDNAMVMKIHQYTDILHRHKCYPGHHYTRIAKNAKRSKNPLLKSLSGLTKGLFRCPDDKPDAFGLICYYNPKEHLPATAETLAILEMALHREKLHPDYQYSMITYRETSKRSPVFSYPRGPGWEYNDYEYGLNPPLTLMSNYVRLEVRRPKPSKDADTVVAPEPVRTMSYESHQARPTRVNHSLAVNIAGKIPGLEIKATFKGIELPGHREVYLPRQPADNGHVYWSFHNGVLVFNLYRYAQQKLPF